MSLIVSRDNPRYKALKRLAEASAHRKRENETILEGAHLCEAYLSKGGVPKLCAYTAAALAHQHVRALVERLPSNLRLELEDRLFASISQLENAVSLLFVIEPPAPHTAVRELSEDAVLLDRIQDPGNLGSILRSAAAAGFHAIYLSKNCAAAWSPKVLRAGMGAHFSLVIHEGCDLHKLVTGAGIPVYATSSHGQALIYDAKLDTGPCGWLVGHEGQGVAAELLSYCTTLSIPQPGGQESLNVAAATAICLFETVRQRRR